MLLFTVSNKGTVMVDRIDKGLRVNSGKNVM